VTLEAPEVVSSATKSGLHLVRDANAAELPHSVESSFQVTLGELNCASNSLDRFRKEPGQALALGQGVPAKLISEQILQLARAIRTYFMTSSNWSR
jgi:hypothetical protein